MPVRNIRRPGYRGLRGFYPSFKVGRSLAFESRLERDHFLLLDADPAVASFEEQPVTIAFTGRRHARRYTPDCRVIYRAQPTTLVEVKYARDILKMTSDERADLDEAHAAARAWCVERGWRFVLRTDQDIVGPALDRAHALHAFSRSPDAVVSPAAVLTFVAKHPGVTLAELAHAFTDGGLGADARRRALHLVWRGHLRDEPFSMPSATTRLFVTEPAQ